MAAMTKATRVVDLNRGGSRLALCAREGGSVAGAYRSLHPSLVRANPDGNGHHDSARMVSEVSTLFVNGRVSACAWNSDVTLSSSLDKGRQRSSDLSLLERTWMHHSLLSVQLKFQIAVLRVCKSTSRRPRR